MYCIFLQVHIKISWIKRNTKFFSCHPVYKGYTFLCNRVIGQMQLAVRSIQLARRRLWDHSQFIERCIWLPSKLYHPALSCICLSIDLYGERRCYETNDPVPGHFCIWLQFEWLTEHPYNNNHNQLLHMSLVGDSTCKVWKPFSVFRWRKGN